MGAACLHFVLPSQLAQLSVGHVVKQSLSTVLQQLLEQRQWVCSAVYLAPSKGVGDSNSDPAVSVVGTIFGAKSCRFVSSSSRRMRLFIAAGGNRLWTIVPGIAYQLSSVPVVLQNVGTLECTGVGPVWASVWPVVPRIGMHLSGMARCSSMCGMGHISCQAGVMCGQHTMVGVLE